MVEPPFESKTAMKLFILESVEGINELIQALNHPKRIEILALLLDKTMSFKTLLEHTDFQKSALSNHLSVLVDKNLIKKLDRGLYRLTIEGEDLISRIAQSYLDAKIREQERLEQLRTLIGRYTTYFEEKHTMSEEQKIDLEVRIVRLEPMRVASVRVISETPENDAWEKMRAWAEPRGLLDDLEQHPVFGFNNPDPSPERKEYGYEFWIRIGSDLESDGEVEIKQFEGGLYAVTTCNLYEDMQSEFFQTEGWMPSWKNLVQWVKSSKYEFGKHQHLEKAHDPNAAEKDFILDLYCPIKE
ncbi:MAG: effector binding domain-containing protein [Promethearchaeota archaeon]